MPGRISPLTISLLALVGVILQGPIICALSCLGAAGAPAAPAAATGMSAHMSLSSLIHHGASSVARQAADESGSVDCHSLEQQGVRAATMTVVGPSASDTLFSRTDALQVPGLVARLHTDGRASPFGFFTLPPERPPAA